MRNRPLGLADRQAWFHTLKTEQIYHVSYKTRQEAMLDIFDYIEVFYNRQRRHSTLGYLTPLQFATGQQAAGPISGVRQTGDRS
jgi:transposase InsO family protein